MKKIFHLAGLVSLVLVFLCLAPFLYILVEGVLTDRGLTLEYYYKVFLASPQYLVRFWKSLALALVIALGQLAASTLAGYGFAKCRFRGKNAMFFLLMALMIMPLQVTLVPNYIVLDRMGLLNTYYALALPMIFVPLGTFIMTQSFRSVSNEIIDAAKLDGCGTLQVLWRIAIPMNKNGLVCTLLLSFLDGWNMVEQPIVYMKDFASYPLSVALASVAPGEHIVQLVCCVLVMIPPLFLFAYFSQELVEGITLGKEK